MDQQDVHQWPHGANARDLGNVEYVSDDLVDANGGTCLMISWMRTCLIISWMRNSRGCKTDPLQKTAPTSISQRIVPFQNGCVSLTHQQESVERVPRVLQHVTLLYAHTGGLYCFPPPLPKIFFLMRSLSSAMMIKIIFQLLIGSPLIMRALPRLNQ